MPDREARRPRRPALTGALALALPVAFAALSARADGLSAEERRLVEYADAHCGEAEGMVVRMVDIPSATQNLDGVRAVGKAFAPEFERIGFATRWEEMPPSMKRAGHLIAERSGTKGKRLLLIGHLDTVLEGRSTGRLEGGRSLRLSGHGAVDMKGGDVVLLFALKALHAAGALDGRRVAVILTGDEEDAGAPISVSRKSMTDLARRSDLALAFEAAIGGTATVARRGVASWSLKVKAKTGHSAGVFTENAGAGAVYEAARILDGFRNKLSGREGLTVNASLALGGTGVDDDPAAARGSAHGKTNVIPGEAVVRGDLRFLSDAQLAAAEATMREVAAANLPRTSAELTVVREYPAMAPTPGNYAALAVLDRASRDLGLGAVTPLPPAERGAGDISFVAHLVDGLDGLGVKGERSHAPDEWADLRSLPDQIKRAALLIYRLTRDAPG